MDKKPYLVIDREFNLITLDLQQLAMREVKSLEGLKNTYQKFVLIGILEHTEHVMQGLEDDINVVFTGIDEQCKGFVLQLFETRESETPAKEVRFSITETSHKSVLTEENVEVA